MPLEHDVAALRRWAAADNLDPPDPLYARALLNRVAGHLDRVCHPSFIPPDDLDVAHIRATTSDLLREYRDPTLPINPTNGSPTPPTPHTRWLDRAAIVLAQLAPVLDRLLEKPKR